MKIIAIGDPHFRIDNILETELFIEKMVGLCSKEKPDRIVILGDVLHTHERIHTVPLNMAYNFIEKMSVFAKTYLLVGNHDMTSNQNFLNTDHWMNGMKKWNNIVVIDKVYQEMIKGFLFTFVPYVPNGRFIDALNTVEHWKDSTMIFAHQEFLNCKMGAIVSVHGDTWDEDNPFVVSGHIHSNQKIGNNIYYPGSSMQNAFGESDRNIIPVITWENDEHSINEVDLGLPQKKIVYKTIDNIENFEMEEKSKDSIKVVMKMESDSDVKSFKNSSKYKELISKGAKISFKTDPKSLSSYTNVSHEDTDFLKILRNIVLSEKNVLLYKDYEDIVNGNIVNEEDVLIL
jgi:DNA repair exonuclease SbcCD nuclease subunit